MALWQQIALPIVTFLLGGVLGFYLSQRYFKKYLKENPPVNENMIRAMMTQMGRKPSEKQVRQVMQSMNDAK
ncbi:MAG: YneF family protein [Bacilli bacterium]|nr:YneF family protein [Bacilli bacterium]